MSDEKKREPIARLREGNVLASVFENQTEKGARHNVTLKRIYQGKDGKPQYTPHLGDGDMLSVRHLAGRVHDAIRERRRELREASRESQPRRERSRNRDRDKDRGR
ncbi:hypothetical protein [Ruegeria arenilitoris]|uniref:hypothetical protein n=1 Tax=Ruegeria arenilitoris TaxID=1173585 RepID=UPI001479A900|nr:hypothetical protein [Ruegeria arenilitoris]